MKPGCGGEITGEITGEINLKVYFKSNYIYIITTSCQEKFSFSNFATFIEN